LTYPTSMWRPIWGNPVDFIKSLATENYSHRLSCGIVCVILRLAVFVEHRLVTDGRTDGRTDTVPQQTTDGRATAYSERERERVR